MGTYRITREWVCGGQAPQVLPAGTLVGDGTPYPIGTRDGRESPPAGSVKVETPKPRLVSTRKKEDEK